MPLRILLSAAQIFSRLPYAPLNDLLAPGPLVVLAPHPDDESLGCGGMIAAWCAAGREVHVVILTDGTAVYPTTSAWPATRIATLRAEEATRAVSILGVPPDHLHFLGANDGATPQSGPEFVALANRLAVLLRGVGAVNLLAPCRHDGHQDHVAASLLAAEVSDRLGIRHLAYPIWGWQGGGLKMPVHGWRIDISAHKATKRAAIAAHASQLVCPITELAHGPALDPDFLARFDHDFEVLLKTGD